MKRMFCLLLSVVTFRSLMSQTVKDRIYIKGGSTSYEEFIKAIYLYPEFKAGMISYKNGQRYFKPINYSRINGTIEYIENKDTMLLADESLINTVTVDNDIFVFTPACLRTISNGKVKLFKYEQMKLGDVQKIGAFGIPNTTAAIETVRQRDNNNRRYDYDVDETIIISRAVTFLIETPGHEYVPASKKNFLKHYSQNEAQLKEYFKSKDPNFNKEDDLLELVKYLDSL